MNLLPGGRAASGGPCEPSRLDSRANGPDSAVRETPHLTVAFERRGVFIIFHSPSASDSLELLCSMMPPRAFPTRFQFSRAPRSVPRQRLCKHLGSQLAALTPRCVGISNPTSSPLSRPAPPGAVSSPPTTKMTHESIHPNDHMSHVLCKSQKDVFCVRRNAGFTNFGDLTLLGKERGRNECHIFFKVNGI